MKLDNYSAIVILSCLTLGVLAIQVYENARFSRATKRRFYATYAVIIVAALSEWVGIALNGAPEWTVGIHRIVKAIDYIFTPVAGICFALQVSDEGAWRKHIWIVAILLANAVLEIASIFTEWTFYIDANNCYRHGALYPVYTVVYCLAIVDLFLSFQAYSKNFRRQNRISLYTIILLICLGVGLQELGDGSIRTVSLALAIGSALLFIHYNEFVQQRNDDNLFRQKELLETDALTGIRSRYAYIRALSEYQRRGVLPRGLAVFSIDVNGLKQVNDSQGHAAGDALIHSAAECILEALGSYGGCYRIGGDEFAAILNHVGEREIDGICAALDAAQRHREGLSLSVGYAAAAVHPELSVEELMDIADRMMYANKEEYYRGRPDAHR